MPPDPKAAAKHRQMDEWLAKAFPGIKAALDQAFDAIEAERQKATPSQQPALDHQEDTLVTMAERYSEPTPPASIGPIKVGEDVDVISEEFGPYEIKYGKLKGTLTVKILGRVALHDDPGQVGFTSTVTSKDKSGGQAFGTKKTFSFSDFDTRELFGLDVKDLSVNFQSEISGTNVSFAVGLTCTLANKHFSLPVSGKFTLFALKMGKVVALEVDGPEFELKVAPATIKYTFNDATQATIQLEATATFTPDWKKIGAESGEKVFNEALQDALEKEVEKEGVEAISELSADAAAGVIEVLMPLALALGVGATIGELLNKYSIAPEVAQKVYKFFLRDFNEAYQRASPAEKAILIEQNAGYLFSAITMAGAAGATAGLFDLIKDGDMAALKKYVELTPPNLVKSSPSNSKK